MRLFQFAKWWWDRSDEFSRTITCFGLFWAFPCAIATIWFGKAAFLAIIVGVFVVMGCWALYGVFYMLRRMWNTFNDEYPSEEVAVIRKLKGIPTPSKQDEIYHPYD